MMKTEGITIKNMMSFSLHKETIMIYIKMNFLLLLLLFVYLLFFKEVDLTICLEAFATHSKDSILASNILGNF